MKKIMFLLIVLLTSCTRNTEFGECVGLNEKERPDLEYRYSAWNISMGILFFGTVIAPVYVTLEALKCPRDVKIIPKQ